jgi:hypothetical protein
VVEPDGSVLAALHVQQLNGLNFITRDDRAPVERRWGTRTIDECGRSWPEPPSSVSFTSVLRDGGPRCRKRTIKTAGRRAGEQ